MKKSIHIIIIILITVAIVGGGYYVKMRQSGGQQVSQIDLEKISSTTLPPTPGVAQKIANPTDKIPEGYVKYTNVRYSFSLYHSPQANITEYDQGQGAMIITLENEQKARGMQIFILPYWQDTITEERFRADVPSGVRTNVEKTFVDGVEAVTFNSVDESLGATREVWFIRGGYLYEVTTFQGLGDWFAPVMQTWKWR